MSQLQTYRIACPTCGDASDVTLHDAINVQSDPDLRVELMENRLNTVRCPACGYHFRVDKPLLYSDPERRLMIYWFPASDQDLERGEKEFRDSIWRLTSVVPEGFDLPDMHLVFSRTELVERIFLCEAGLNERIIEYIKYLIFLQNLNDLDPSAKTLLFNTEDSTDESLCFVVQDLATLALESMYQYSRQAYEAICEMFDQDEQTATLLELFPGPHINARTLLLRESEVRGG
jgi:hypothetical protein